MDTERNADKEIWLTNTVFTTLSPFFNLQISSIVLGYLGF